MPSTGRSTPSPRRSGSASRALYRPSSHEADEPPGARLAHFARHLVADPPWGRLRRGAAVPVAPVPRRLGRDPGPLGVDRLAIAQVPEVPAGRAADAARAARGRRGRRAARGCALAAPRGGGGAGEPGGLSPPPSPAPPGGPG